MGILRRDIALTLRPDALASKHDAFAAPLFSSRRTPARRRLAGRFS
jgi:hypothetical protein